MSKLFNTIFGLYLSNVSNLSNLSNSLVLFISLVLLIWWVDVWLIFVKLLLSNTISSLSISRLSLFINLNPKSKNYGCYYYDSNGRGAPLEVKNFVSNVISQNSKLTNKELKFYQNTIKHQFKNSECGIFSLHFMDQCLKNVSFNSFINS